MHSILPMLWLKEPLHARPLRNGACNDKHISCFIKSVLKCVIWPQCTWIKWIATLLSVIVWRPKSSLVHTTVVPTETSSKFGWNALSFSVEASDTIVTFTYSCALETNWKLVRRGTTRTSNSRPVETSPRLLNRALTHERIFYLSCLFSEFENKITLPIFGYDVGHSKARVWRLRP